ncbi:flavonoid 3',5'-hydroxylase 2-like [Vitis vinifera]|uniref:flavonoid 3',5'-hydroxylase 2-like n=1 Tax=Vitis vinifera TaxID=29760 RepID=UPI00054008C3|nr:flavonoid 3',5'-hydroxylase 2-like [Vitis vinifera]|eukprot:XP_010651674.1 PREDICTED: flavonoid 3',5'-hydroxylase 2-like [Vitis vinifera]
MADRLTLLNIALPAALVAPASLEKDLVSTAKALEQVLEQNLDLAPFADSFCDSKGMKTLPLVFVPFWNTETLAGAAERRRRPEVRTAWLGEEDEGAARMSNEFKDMVVELMTTAGYFNIGDFIPSIAWLDIQGIQRGMKHLHRKFDRLLTKMMEEHTASAHERKGNPDFLDVIMANQENSTGEKLTITNIKALLLNLFTAGTDTSSSVIEWSLAEMLKNPSILKRAHEEMDQVIGRSRRLVESDLPKLPYLQAICKESFRKHPSTPLNLPRVSTQACEVNGYYIPENTRLSVNIWAIGRDPNVWESPEEFRPERFLSGRNEKIDPRGNDFELIPFGAGRRICAGTRMGIVLVEYILGTLVHSFDWKMPDGVEINMDEAFGLALQKAVSLSAMVTPRLHQSAYAV